MFTQMFRSVIEGSLEFDPAILTSALRIATAYGYPALRAFTINKLEKASLSAIQRIRIAREFRFTSWEAPAYVELCERDEAITEAEANVLGMSAFVQVAKIREKEQRRKGKDIDAQLEEEKVDEEERKPEEEPGASDPKLEVSHGVVGKAKKKKSKRDTGVVSDANSKPNLGDAKQVGGLEDNGVKESCECISGCACRAQCAEIALPRSGDSDTNEALFHRSSETES
jgi:hypothetical protein